MKTFKADDPAFEAFVSEVVMDKIREGLIAGAVRVQGIILNEVIPAEERQPVDRGAYRAGFRVEPTDDGADIINTSPHAPFIEFGVRAENVKTGPAMVKALEEWVVRKGIATREEAASVAYAIAVSMKRKGIFAKGKGLRIMAKAMSTFGGAEAVIEEVVAALEE